MEDFRYDCLIVIKNCWYIYGMKPLVLKQMLKPHSSTEADQLHLSLYMIIIDHLCTLLYPARSVAGLQAPQKNNPHQQYPWALTSVSGSGLSFAKPDLETARCWSRVPCCRVTVEGQKKHVWVGNLERSWEQLKPRKFSECPRKPWKVSVPKRSIQHIKGTGFTTGPYK